MFFILPRAAGEGDRRRRWRGLFRKLLSHAHDCICCFIKALYQIGSRDPHHGDASRSQPRVAPQITQWPNPHIVAYAFDLNGEP